MIFPYESHFFFFKDDGSTLTISIRFIQAFDGDLCYISSDLTGSQGRAPYRKPCISECITVSNYTRNPCPRPACGFA